jgi:predicted Zn-dependent peptidase
MIYKKKLTNNITALCQEIDLFESVVVEVWLNVGSRDETIENNGISHFLEHLAFKGTGKRTARDIAIFFDSIGGYINAATSRENTIYTIKILAEHLELALDVFADIILHSDYKKDEIERERNVILQELALSNDNPDEVVFEQFMALSYKSQSLGRPIIGSKENVQRLCRDDFLNYNKLHYQTSGIIVAATGKLNHQHFFDLLEKYFSKAPTKEVNSVIRLQETKFHTGIKVIKNELIEQAHMVIGCEGVSYHHPNFLCQELASNILGGGMSSRLFQEVRESRGLAYNISAFNYIFADSGLFGVYADIAEENILETLKIVGDQINQLSGNVSLEEVERTKQQVRSAFLMSKESLEVLASRLGNNYSRYAKIIDPQEVIKKYLSIEPKDISNYLEDIGNKFKKPTISLIINPARASNLEEELEKLYS